MYKKSGLNTTIACDIRAATFVFGLDDATVERPVYLVGDFLITDVGTGPSGRGLLGYNIVTKKEVFFDKYGEVEVVHPPDGLEYWRSSETLATELNCPHIEKITEGGFGAELQVYVRRNLVSGLVEFMQERCVATQ